MLLLTYTLRFIIIPSYSTLLLTYTLLLCYALIYLHSTLILCSYLLLFYALTYFLFYALTYLHFTLILCSYLLTLYSYSMLLLTYFYAMLLLTYYLFYALTYTQRFARSHPFLYLPTLFPFSSSTFFPIFAVFPSLPLLLFLIPHFIFPSLFLSLSLPFLPFPLCISLYLSFLVSAISRT